MTDKLEAYRKATQPVSHTTRLWPLYGGGLENLGRNGQTIEVELPQLGPDELLVRHDACGLCFSDTKVINQGQKHPRIFKDMSKEPVVLGHEVSLTVVGVGENLRDQYKPGDRFIIQADIWIKGVNLAYGYMLQGGLSTLNVLDWRVLNGDHGNYLIPVRPETGYAESALTEPWACVTAAYELTYRDALKAGGVTWIVGSEAVLKSVAAGQEAYGIGTGFDAKAHPAKLLLSRVPAAFDGWLRARADALGVEVIDVADPCAPAATFEAHGLAKIDDIVVLGNDPELIEAVSPYLADRGIFALVTDEKPARKVNIDVGRVHYNDWLYVGGSNADIALAYSQVPARANLKKGGLAWFVGAGGPMGRMHLQRAIQVLGGPSTIVCTDVSDLRLQDLIDSFSAEAQARGVELVCLNPTKKEAYAAAMAGYLARGFDDIMILAPVAAVITDSANYLADGGVLNVFAGVVRGTMAQLDLGDVALRGVRCIGHTASSIEDLTFMLNMAESGTLTPNRSVAAIGSLSAARDGMDAVMKTVYPGKIVIFPQIKEFPLTSLPELKEKLPTVYAKLKDGHEWTNEAEEEFLRIMLPD
jgi:threonine dehydrogenase-like Zn-dependent dehydrogenase